ncbi:hypothetical protein ACHAQA_008535 [Verticillium albo-atrum]
MVNRKPEIFAAVIVTFVSATVSLASRLFARRTTKVSLWWDDWLVIGAWVFAAGFSASILLWIFYGLGQDLAHVPHLTTDEALFYGKLILYNVELLYAFSLGLTKISILSFFWRMFKTSNIRLPIKILFACSVTWLVARTFVAVFHCWPVEAFWDTSVDGVCPINDSDFFFWSVLAHLVIDVAILALPVLQVRQLQLAAGQKVAVTGLFMFGSLVCIASVVVLVESANFDPASVEMPANIAGIMIWASVEVNLAIVSACLPMLQPIFKMIVPGSLLRSICQTQHAGRKNGVIEPTTLRGGRENDDASSTFNLADPELGKRGSLVEGEEPDAPGLYTTISGGHPEMMQMKDEGAGILVRNETLVRISSR